MSLPQIGSVVMNSVRVGGVLAPHCFRNIEETEALPDGAGKRQEEKLLLLTLPPSTRSSEESPESSFI